MEYNYTLQFTHGFFFLSSEGTIHIFQTNLTRKQGDTEKFKRYLF